MVTSWRQGSRQSAVSINILLRMEASFGIMDEEEDIGSSVSSFSSEDDDVSRASLGSSEEELQEDATSSGSSSSLNDQLEEGRLFEMSSLMSTLPFKRGLSKYFEGKSQSFTSLSNVSCLEDLAKAERPCKKKLKSCKSYGGGLMDAPKPLSPTFLSRAITKKVSKGSFSSRKSRRVHSSLGNRTPIPPQRSSSLSSEILLFASRA